jgi:hypothetical protein
LLFLCLVGSAGLAGVGIEGGREPLRILTFREAMPLIGVETSETLGLKGGASKRGMVGGDEPILAWKS